MNSNTLRLHKSDYFPHQWEFLKSGMIGKNKDKSAKSSDDKTKAPSINKEKSTSKETKKK